MNKVSSYRQILRSSSIIGGSSFVTVLIGLVRTKAIAVLLGPAGVGVIGLLQNLMTTAATLAAMGLGTVGTRQIAESVGRGDVSAVAVVRRALFWGTLLLAACGALIFWLLRDVFASQFLSGTHLADNIGWLALGVGLSVASGSQGALLNGLRRIGDIGKVSIASSLIASMLGVGAIMFWGEQGILAFVLASPVASFFIGHLYVARLPSIKSTHTSLSQLVVQWRMLARLGSAFMVAGLALTVSQLLVRTMVDRDLGSAALGHFEAAWMISMTYVGFILRAMGTDYYPRLTALIQDNVAVNRLVNEQIDVALLLAGPVFLLTLGFAPWVIELLYSNQFTESVTILRWQILGDMFKVVSWPLGFIILAAGDGRTFMLTESFCLAIFVCLVWLGLPYLGIQATGVAFLGMYSIYLPLVHFLAKKRTGFKWDVGTFKTLVVLFAAGCLICLTANLSSNLAAALALFLSMAIGLKGFVRLAYMADIGGFLGKASIFCRNVIIKIGIWHD